MTAREFNFDGLVGPTHNYAGLSFGNVASETHLGQSSNPRQAALQGLAKIQTLSHMGLAQAILPPHDRPHIPTLRALGFTGSLSAMLDAAWKASPPMLGTVMSASPMWTANAATVSPSADTSDGRVHFTPANLTAMAHRSLEAPMTSRILKTIFAGEDVFAHHDPLPGHGHFGDEGAANHTRLCESYDQAGVEVFVYGKEAWGDSDKHPKIYPARQTLEASQAVARGHGLDPERTLFLQQNPDVIDQGVFHNDVIAVGNGPVLFCHSLAFADHSKALKNLASAFGSGLEVIEVTEEMVTVEEAVNSYLFNSQLVSVPGDDFMRLIAPVEAEESQSVKTALDQIVENPGAIGAVHYLDLRQSMNNGGGPACLRLRVVLSEKERSSILPRVFLDDDLYKDLKGWIETHYREELSPNDLRDPILAEESFTALDELTQILDLGSLYDFQRN
jgi:succinylarginine dihydrolase